ncbi:MAG: hypothetical protein OEW98_07285 [Betaproteobacteria bacterium]|nr:hypothetical protein [Betaproteobacteria bacterium]
MNILRKTSAFVLASVALAFTLPAAAADKDYALKLTASAYVGDRVTVNAVFRNTSPSGGASSNIKSLQLEAPETGVELIGTTTPGCRVLNSTTVRCENLTPIPKNGEFPMTVTANLTAAACGARWNLNNDDVNTGAQYGVGNWFTLVFYPTSLPAYTATLTAGLAPSVSIDGPANLLLGVAATYTATVTNACGVATDAATITATASASPEGGGLSLSQSGSEFTLTATGTTTSATLNVASTNPVASNSATFQVYLGNLTCVDVPVTGAVPSFNGSTLGATGDTSSGFFAGDRVIKNGLCPLAAYRTVNTIGVAAGATADGYKLPSNFALMSYTVSGDSILLDHTITFAPVWSDVQGLFNPARIKYCAKVTASPDGTYDCTGLVPANLKVAQGCLNPAIHMDSIPSIGGIKEPGCARAWETQIIAPVAGSTFALDTCGGVTRPATGNRACMVVSIDVTEGKDPPWGMTEE